MNKQKTVDEFITEFSAFAAAVTKGQFPGAASFYTKRCESPIERVLYAAILAQHKNTPLRIVLHNEPWERTTLMMAGAHFWPQTALGNYRVDFAVFLVTNEREIGRLVIECDGHDFHERTKVQARNDKSRDRYLVGDGFKVIRYAGSEIWRDPMRCAEEVLEIVESIWVASQGYP